MWARYLLENGSSNGSKGAGNEHSQKLGVMRRILISADSVEIRVAVLDGKTLWALQSEGAETEKVIRGNIYKARVVSIERGLDAAFLDLGLQKHGFLPLDEVSLKSLRTITGKVRSRTLGVGDYVLVQVAREELGHKGALLTMKISLPGRLVVLMPFSEHSGVSRRLSEQDRRRLRSALRHLKVGEGFGIILRTCGAEAFDLGEVQSELDELTRVWKKIVSDFRRANKPGLIHQEGRLHIRFLRDFLDSSVSEVVVEGEQVYREVFAYVQDKIPRFLQCIRLHREGTPLFCKYGIEQQAMSLLSNRVDLPSGGSIVIAQTEALWAIDVNSGRTRRKGIEETAFLTNMEAAREIARQIVLRDMGGLIVVDFIDMESAEHREKVCDELVASLRQDKARLHVSSINDFGLLALSRQRLGHGCEGTMMEACPVCGGTGKVEKPFSVARRVVTQLREALSLYEGYGAHEKVTVRVHPRVASELYNRWRDILLDLEKKNAVRIIVSASEDMEQTGFEVVFSDTKLDTQGQKARLAPEVNENTTSQTLQKKKTVGQDNGEIAWQESRKRRRTPKKRWDMRDRTDRYGGGNA